MNVDTTNTVDNESTENGNGNGNGNGNENGDKLDDLRDQNDIYTVILLILIGLFIVILIGISINETGLSKNGS